MYILFDDLITEWTENDTYCNVSGVFTTLQAGLDALSENNSLCFIEPNKLYGTEEWLKPCYIMKNGKIYIAYTDNDEWTPYV